MNIGKKNRMKPVFVHCIKYAVYRLFFAHYTNRMNSPLEYNTYIKIFIIYSLVVNFSSVQMIREILPSMLERNSGHIVTISSMATLKVMPLNSTYAATKCALNGMLVS